MTQPILNAESPARIRLQDISINQNCANITLAGNAEGEVIGTKRFP